MILIVDDDSAIRSSLSFMLRRAKYDVTAVASPTEAIETVRATEPDLILMDMNFTLTTSGEEGIYLLKQVKVFRPEVPVILMTAWGSIDLAVKGMQAGAFDFITKPWNNASLMQRIETALELSGKKEIITTDDTPLFDRSNIIGDSPELRNILDTVARIAPTNASVLITGESGTGKELIAEAIHRNSNRKREAFVKVNLGGISQSLFESEMFGHKRGAFTDATSDRVGRFEMAHRGTIFLDEIGELDISCQVKLLRVLQEQTFEVLGDSHPRKVDIRVVSATNVDLAQMVKEHTFREDLFWRINLINIHLPALRERKSDIPLLVNHFAKSLCTQNNIKNVEFSAEAMEYLANLPYPGNIRELKNLVERTLLISGSNVITASQIQAQHSASPVLNVEKHLNTSKMTLDEIEMQTIKQALEKHNGNISQVAAMLGISRPALYRRLEKYGIKFK